MSDSLKPSEREKRETAFANETRPADSGNLSWPADPYSSDRYLVPDDDAPIVHQERLFSRKVLFGWAFATLLVVFAVTVILPMVVPIVKQTVEASVVARMKERGMIRPPSATPTIPEVPEVPEVPEIPERAEQPERPEVPAAQAAPAAPAASGAVSAPSPTTSGRHAKTPAPAATNRH